MRDLRGNVLAVYEHMRGESGNGTFTLTEQHLYGASRLGMKKRDLALNATNANESPATYYELTNHLGNVMAVISDEANSSALVKTFQWTMRNICWFSIFSAFF